MNTFTRVILVTIAFGTVSFGAFAASAEIEEALDILLADYDIEERLTIETQGDSSGLYLIQRGDTLDSIIQRLVGDTAIKKRWLREAFVQANPQSFRNRNPNFLYAGEHLRVPTADDIMALMFDTSAPQMQNRRAPRDNWVHFP